jgi:hypothetical protein
MWAGGRVRTLGLLRWSSRTRVRSISRLLTHGPLQALAMAEAARAQGRLSFEYRHVVAGLSESGPPRVIHS